jgi:hypothetical protein
LKGRGPDGEAECTGAVRLEVFHAVRIAAGQRFSRDDDADNNVDSEIFISNEMKNVKKIKFIFLLRLFLWSLAVEQSMILRARVAGHGRTVFVGILLERCKTPLS